MCVIRAALLFGAPANIATLGSMPNANNQICLYYSQVRSCTRLQPAQSCALSAASPRTAGQDQCPLPCVCHGLEHKLPQQTIQLRGTHIHWLFWLTKKHRVWPLAVMLEPQDRTCTLAALLDNTDATCLQHARLDPGDVEHRLHQVLIQFPPKTRTKHGCRCQAVPGWTPACTQ